MKKFLPFLTLLLFSPGAFAQGSFPLVTISDIQSKTPSQLGSNQDQSSLLGDTVRVRGVVVIPPGQAVATSVSTRWVWISDGTGPFSGLNIRDTDWTPTAVEGSYNLPQTIVGDSIEIVGVVEEFPVSGFCTETQFNPLNNYLDSLGGNIRFLGVGTNFPGSGPNSIPSVAVGDLNNAANNWQPVTGEQHEGSLIQVNNVIVSQITANTSDRNRFIVIDSLNNAVEIYDRHWVMRSNAATGNPNGVNQPGGIATVYPNYVIPSVGTCYEYIRGIIESQNFAGSLYYSLSPFDTSHFKTKSCAVPQITAVTRNQVIPTPNTQIVVTATVNDPSGTTPIDTVKLFYATGIASSSYTQVTMTQIGTTNQWEGTIPGQPDTTFIKYYVRATNVTNVPTVFPAAAPNSNYIFVRVRAGGQPTVRDVQFTPFANGNSGLVGSQVSVTGVVTMKSSPITATIYRLFMQQEGETEWAGLRVFGTNINSLAGSFNVGDRITVTGNVVEDFNVTSITSATTVVAASPATGTISPLNINPNQFTAVDAATNERFESMLLKFTPAPGSDSIYVVHTNADAPSNFGEYRVGRVLADSTQGSRVLVGRAEGSRDVSYVNNATGIIMNPPLVPDTVRRGARMSSLSGIMYFSFSNWKFIPRTNADFENFVNADVVTGLDFADPASTEISVYPNPAESSVFVKVSGTSNRYTVSLTDMAGRLVKTTDILPGTNTISTGDIGRGAYVLTISSENEGIVNRTKLVINK